MANRQRVSFWGDKNVLLLIAVTAAQKSTKLYTLCINWMVCELYLNKAIIYLNEAIIKYFLYT